MTRHNDAGQNSLRRVLIVEDEVWLRQDLTTLLDAPAAGLQVAGSFATGETAIRALREGLAVDLALVDLGLPDVSGVEVIRTLRRRRPEAVAVAFTVFDDERSVLSALQAGARGYLLKSTPFEQLRAALDDAAAGGAPMTPGVARLVVESMEQPPASDGGDELASLTPRELDVLGLLTKGHTYSDTAHALGIALGTVQTHVRNIYGKLEVASKAEATAAALRRGLA